MKVDLVKKLHQKKYRQQLGCFLVEGEHLIQELEQTQLQGCRLYLTESHQHWPSRFEKTIIGERQMAQISDTKSPQGMVAVVPFEAVKRAAASASSDSKLRTLYLYQIQDPGNLGTIIRTLTWFGGWRLLLSPGSVDPFNPKVVRSSMGAIFHLPIEVDVEFESVRANFKSVAILDMQGESPASASFRQHDCYLFGNEARGVPHELLEGLPVSRYCLPGAGTIESLNLASAVNMCAWELAR